MYDCEWWPTTYDLTEARQLAEAKHPDATIGVHAECLIEGVQQTAKVLIYVKGTIGKTNDEVCELLDREIDAFIVFRDRTGPIPFVPKQRWDNYRKRTGKSLYPLVEEFIKRTQKVI